MAKTGEMETAEVACRKVLADEETKKRKAEAKEADKADDNDDIHTERVVSKKRAGGAGMPRKKRKMHVGATPLNADLEHVSSPTPINHSLPVVAPANEEHSLPRDRREVTPLGALVTYPSLPNGDLPILAAWCILCLMVLQSSNLGSFYVSWRSRKANVLLRFEALTEEHVDLVYSYESCKDVKALYKECKKDLPKVQSAFDENEKKKAEELSVKQADRIKHLEEALKQSEEVVHQLRLDREKFVVELEKDVQAILKATPSVDPTSSSTFIEEYNKLFDKRYPYVDKVARAYLPDLPAFRTLC
ncbi:hypothetical protein Tco_0264361 [Tanacetum coccineum]